MRILFPFVGDSIGGSHKSAIILIQSLISNGIDVHVVLHYENGPLSNYLKSHKLKFDIIPTKYLAGSSPRFLNIIYGVLVNSYSINSYIRKNNISIVHANDLRINLTWAPIVRLMKTKFVWHQRTLLSKSYFWNLIPYLSNYLIAISETVFSSIPSNVSKHKKRLIYNPINIDPLYNNPKSKVNLIRKSYEIANNCTLLGYVGRLNEEWKRVDFLISCFTSKEFKKFHLIIAGDCSSKYCKYLEKIVANFQIQDKVTFTGYIADPTMLISYLDILVAPSRDEPFGRTLLEAMSQKTIVLASKSGGHLDIIKDNYGFLFELDDRKNFNEQIKFILNNKDQVNQTIEKSFQYVKKNYSTKSHMNQVLNVYHSL
jgi:glycosyltransferase involved in cell wall biosynthesis